MLSRRGAAFLCLCATVVAFFAPHLLRGEVIFAHDNSLEVGAHASDESAAPDESSDRRESGDPDDVVASSPEGARLSNRKFSDESSVYVPEIHHHLHGDRSRWISTWNPHVEMGRPTMQLSGFGPAYPLTALLELVCDDAVWVYTWLVVLTVALTAIFGFGFLSALGLHPWACFTGAAFLSLGVHSVYWVTLPMVHSGVCWTLAILWSVTIFVARPSSWAALALAFATYALLMSAYPQQIVWHAYFVAAFALVRVLQSTRVARERALRLLALASCAALGLAAALPAYLDLALASSRSARTATSVEFLLLKDTPTSLAELASFLAQIYDSFWIGNPMRQDYPGTFAYLCVTPLVAGLASLVWLEGEWRRARVWLALLAVTGILTVWPDALRIGIDHLGLSLSRFAPLRAAPILWAVLAALAVDRVLEHGFERRWLASAVALAPLGFTLAVRCGQEAPIDWTAVAASAALSSAVAAFVITRRAAWLAPCVLFAIFRYGEPILLTQPEASIQFTSPLVDALREETAASARYAFVGGKAPGVLPPNQECRLGLASIHTYNSLSPVAYQEWVLRLSPVGTQAYGRWFRRISSEAKLDEGEARTAGIGVFVTAGRLRAPWLAAPKEVDGIRIYRTRKPPIDCAHVVTSMDITADRASLAKPLRDSALVPLTCTERRDDRLRFELVPQTAETLLFVSTQHHPHWVATSGERALGTVLVDDFYLGVAIPPGTTHVEIAFRPWITWAWLPYVCFPLAGLACFARRRRAHST